MKSNIFDQVLIKIRINLMDHELLLPVALKEIL